MAGLPRIGHFERREVVDVVDGGEGHQGAVFFLLDRRTPGGGFGRVAVVGGNAGEVQDVGEVELEFGLGVVLGLNGLVVLLAADAGVAGEERFGGPDDGRDLVDSLLPVGGHDARVDVFRAAGGFRAVRQGGSGHGLPRSWHQAGQCRLRRRDQATASRLGGDRPEAVRAASRSVFPADCETMQRGRRFGQSAARQAASSRRTATRPPAVPGRARHAERRRHEAHARQVESRAGSVAVGWVRWSTSWALQRARSCRPAPLDARCRVESAAPHSGGRSHRIRRIEGSGGGPRRTRLFGSLPESVSGNPADPA